jgi:putative addiction module killer protein
MHLAVREYVSPDGASPYRAWLERLDVDVRARVQARVLRFEMGNLGDHKAIGGGVWEARLPFGPGYRLYFGKAGRALLCSCSGATRGPRSVTSAALDATGPTTSKGGNVARRSRDWNEGLARDLQDPAFARAFLLAAIEEDVSLQQALGKVIRSIGVKEFAAKIGMASPNLLRAIHPRHNPTQETINRLLRPFGLRLSLAPIRKPRRRRAA